MKVLITGGAGYIGSHTAKAIANAGHQVIIFDNLSNGHEKLINNIHIVKGDIKNKRELEQVFTATDFDAVVHLAAKIDVKESQTDPGIYYENNVFGTINLLETMRSHEVKTIVYSSTAAVYGNTTSPIKETTPLNPVSTYGKTNAMIEEILHDYHKAYQFSVVTFRYFNAAGASTDGQLGELHKPETHLIPLMIEKITTDQSFTIFGADYETPDKTPVRDFVHVMDIAQAHVLGLEHAHFEKPYEVFNIGSGTGYSVKQIIAAVEKITDKKLKVEQGPRRDGDASILTADIQKIQKMLGWKSEYSELDTILQTALHWYKKNTKQAHSN